VGQQVGALPSYALTSGTLTFSRTGSSAAYFLSHFAREAGLETDVTVFEANDYLGGRSTVLWPWNDEPFEDPCQLGEPDIHEKPVELGASIFVSANLNLQKAAKVFELELVEHGGEDGETAIWDGEQWVYEETGKFVWDWWGKAKLLWRYVPFHASVPPQAH
jgi:prenylcysteine oxidase/farnesylcysteine lyase